MNEEKIISELNLIKDSFPKEGFNCTFLFKIKRHDLNSAISKSGLGIAYFQKKFGYKSRKPLKYWKSLDNLINEIKPHIKNNKFPALQYMQRNIKGGVLNSIYYFGGPDKVAEIMGCDKIEHNVYKADDGHFLNSIYELIFDNYLYVNKIPHKVNEEICPESKYRYDFKIDDYYIEIWGYEKDRTGYVHDLYNKKRILKEELYKNNNLKLISIEAELFKNPTEKVKSYFDELVANCNFKPTSNNSLLIIENTIKHAYYWDEEKIIDELKILIPKLGKFPTHQELYKLNLGGLRDAIVQHGGINYFTEKLGLKCKKVKNGYWTDDIIIKKLKY